MHRSGDRADRAFKKACSFAVEGVKIEGMDNSSASLWTGDLVRIRFLPVGAGGCVTTASIEKVELTSLEAWESFCRTFAATLGVPRKTTCFRAVALHVGRCWWRNIWGR